MFAKQKTKRPRVVSTLKTKLKIIADFEHGKRTVNIGNEHGIPSTTVRTTVDDKNINMLQK
jgi:hypothetical protein